MSCTGKDIEIPLFSEKYSVTVSRSELTGIVVLCDLAIVIGFIITTGVLDHYIYKEAEELDNNFVQITDFSLRVKNLPEIQDYKSLEQLRAMLQTHLEMVV